MIGKDINQITEEDLLGLIHALVIEGKTIEYKQSLPSNSEADKKEFLADVSSFANASGGDLVYGVIEDKDTGEPKALEGLDITNPDSEMQRLDSIIRDGIEPRISSVTIKSVKLSNDKTALIVRVGKSWISPHRVTFKGHDKFYGRSSNGKYPLDVGELRVAFTISETLADRVRKFREDRLLRLVANETPVLFNSNPKVILHLLPVISYSPAQIYNIHAIASDPGKMSPMHSMGYDYKYNIDGFITFSGGDRGRTEAYSYVQLYKSGIIEAVDASLIESRPDMLTFSVTELENQTVESLKRYLGVLRELRVELPIFVFLTLTGVKGYKVLYGHTYGMPSREAIDRDILLLPEVVIESYDVDVPSVLKHCFDALFNACGLPKSNHYDASGQWIEK